MFSARKATRSSRRAGRATPAKGTPSHKRATPRVPHTPVAVVEPPAKKLKFDVEGSPSRATAPFRVSAKNFPQKVRAVLEGTAHCHVSGSMDGGFSWATSQGRLYVWENAGATVLHDSVMLPDGDHQDHPARLVRAHRSESRTGLVVVSPRGTVWFFDDIYYPNYQNASLPLLDGELVVDVADIKLHSDADFQIYACCTNHGRMFSVVKPAGASHMLVSRFGDEGAAEGDNAGAVGGLLSTVGGWLGWGAGTGAGAEGGDDSLAGEPAMDGDHRRSFLVPMPDHGDGALIHVVHKDNDVLLAKWGVPHGVQTPAKREGDPVSVAGLFGLGGGESEGVPSGPPRLTIVSLSYASYGGMRRLYAFVIRKVVMPSQYDEYVYEMQEYAVGGDEAGAPLARLRTHKVLQSKEYSLAGLRAVTRGQRVPQGTAVTRKMRETLCAYSYVVAAFPYRREDPFQALEVTWPFDSDASASSRTLTARGVAVSAFIDLAPAESGAFIYSRERDYAIYSPIMPAMEVPDNGSGAAAEEAEAVTGMNFSMDLEGASRAIQMAVQSLAETGSVATAHGVVKGFPPQLLCDAALSHSRDIIDNGVGSGDLWADISEGNETQFSAAGHKLVRQFLDEKKRDHDALCHIMFKGSNGFKASFPAVCDEIERHQRCLTAAISLVAYQEHFVSDLTGGRRSIVSEAIVSVVMSTRKWTAAKLQRCGLVAADVFYSSPSLILDLLAPLSEGVEDQKRRRLGVEEYLPIVNEAVAGMDVLVTQLAVGREKEIVASSLVLFSPVVRKCFESMLLAGIRAIETASNTPGGSHLLSQKLDSVKASMGAFVWNVLLVLHHLKTADTDAQFERVVKRVVIPLLNVGMLESAIAIGEKYFHHELLAKVCEREEEEKGEDTGRLRRYMNLPQLKASGFPEFVYGRLLQKKDVARVLNQPEERSDDLMEYLVKHPELSWVHAIRTERYNAACDALENTAGGRSDSFQTQHMLWSIAKLSMHAAGDGGAERRSQLNAKLTIAASHRLLLGYIDAIGGDLHEPAMDAALERLRKGERVAHKTLVALFASAIKIMCASASMAEQLAGLMKVAVEYPWQAQAGEGISDAERTNLLSSVWKEILVHDVDLGKKLVEERKRRGGVDLDAAYFKAQVEAASLLYFVVRAIARDAHLLPAYNMDPHLLHSTVRNNRDSIRAGEGVVRMYASIVNLGKAAGIEP